ncbi:MAG: hypothetical protein NC417_07695 [Candidatus Gastranaerophilales bacterium]|nr:hypothetical protein [Candidatus Gastranaerophilales bacterium]
MKLSTYEDLKKLLQEFYEKRDALQVQIDDNELHIQEAKVYAQKISDREQKDFDVFSPRRKKETYKSDLQQSEIKKADYEEQNARLIQERDHWNRIIDVLERAADESRVEESGTEKSGAEKSRIEEKDSSDSLVADLESVNHKMELSVRFIRPDPVRAKLELTRAAADLQNIIASLEN